jgi:hypothetical protein
MDVIYLLIINRELEYFFSERSTVFGQMSHRISASCSEWAYVSISNLMNTHREHVWVKRIENIAKALILLRLW